MAQYAKTTTVPIDKSRSEIEKVLTKYGASAFGYGWSDDRAMIQFVARDRQIRFVLNLPDRTSREFTHTAERGVKRSPADVERFWERACRQSWRALLIIIKAKLEAVESGIFEFDDEFLAHVVLPDGSTAGAWLKPQIAAAYEAGQMPELMLALGPGGSG